ncbi:hypothetical protein LZL87_000864 [Fusarium oxysporum]|nr:hypothetical protein LZL87_000864 [Fusarium oxysporum]
MATQTNAPKTPSKNIEEFLQRHPQVRTGAAAKADLDHLHEHGDTFCVINKLFDNALLHKDYDPDSLKLIFAFAYINDEQAMANYAEDAEADKIQINYTIDPSKNPATWPSPGKQPSFIDIPKVDVIFININANSDFRLLRTSTNENIDHAVLQVTHIARGLYSCTVAIFANKLRDELLWKNRFPWDHEGDPQDEVTLK